MIIVSMLGIRDLVSCIYLSDEDMQSAGVIITLIFLSKVVSYNYQLDMACLVLSLFIGLDGWKVTANKSRKTSR